MLPDAFSRPRKMHLDERWIVKAAPRRSTLPDAFSRPRKIHLDKQGIFKAAPRRSTLPDAFSRPRKTHLHVMLLPFLCSFPELAPDHGFRQG